MLFRHALRSLRRTPLFASTVILALALGIATVGSMFAIIYGVLLAPLPYGEPDRLVSVSLQTPEKPRIQQPSALYFTYAELSRQLDGVGFYRTGSTNVETDGDAADSVVATWVTASMIPLLRVDPVLGRSFTPEEEIRGGPNAVILSEAEWRNRFGAAPDVLGKTLVVNSAPREVVGVMPAHFAFPAASTRLWLPVKHTGSGKVEDFFYSGVARLAPGATVEQAQLELAAVLPKMGDRYPQLQSGSSTTSWFDAVRPVPIVQPLHDEFTGEIARTLWMLAAAAALVLLVAWASVANLMLIRADARQLELAVREALGGSRLRAATHFVGESLLLGAVAGVLALGASYGAVRVLVAFGPTDVPRLAELGVGPSTIGFIALVTLMGVLLCAAIPATRVRRTSLSNHLHDGARGQSAGKSRQRLRATITVLQIALALVVAVGSALLLRTAYRLSQVQPGFDASEVTTTRILLPHASYRDSTTVGFYARLSERVRALPSVSAAGLTMRVPLGSGAMLSQTFRVGSGERTVDLPVNVVDGGYFETMGIPLRSGRSFGSLEQERGSNIVISQSAAALLFGDSDGAAAVGKSLVLAPSGLVYTVVGVVGDVRDQDLSTPPSAMIYRPQVVPLDPIVEPAVRPSMVLVVKSSAPAVTLVPAIRKIVYELDPKVPLFEVETMDDVVRASTARLALTLALMTTAAGITLLLGAIGLYGVMAYMVALRTREFGIRVALGADPKAIARLVAQRGLMLTASGVAAGFVLYAMAAPFLRASLYGITTTDPATLIGATLVMICVSILASWLPARRAARVDPADALRAE